MNEQRKAAWAEIRKGGRDKYLKGRVLYGLFLGFTISILRETLNFGFSLENLTSPQFLSSLAVGIITFPVVFYWLGVWIWRKNEKTFEEEDKFQKKN
ncbi:MAG: hypothetical protein OHK0038_07310 [Flammeovirgaceae bacterium]